MIKTYCYAPIASDMSRKAPKNKDGTCFIPREYPCDSSSQCRPGTQCLPNGKDQSLVCDLGNSTESILDVDATLTIVRKSLNDLLDALRKREGEFMDTTTGVLSPLLAATRIPLAHRLDYVQGIVSSFDTGRFKDMGATSRSGATFMFSGDSRFIAKTVRPDEYIVFANELLPALCKHLPLSWTLDWPKLVASSTAMNVPIVAFKNGDRHFLILPTVNTLRQEARSVPEDWGKPIMYDVKPLRAHSHQRADFVKWLAQSQSFPARASSPEAIRSQWDVLFEMLKADMAFLEAHAIVDYSLLVETYEGKQVQKPGPQCVSLAGCFSNTSVPCRVLCLNIIDYTLKYDNVLKVFESKVIRNKWDDYEAKAKHFAECIGDMGFGHDAQAPAQLRYKKERVPACQSYGDLLCTHLEVAKLKNCEYDYFTHSVSKCSDPICVFEDAYASMCQPFLAPNCESKVNGVVAGHFAWHVFASLGMASGAGAAHMQHIAVLAKQEEDNNKKSRNSGA
jgi:hypothetical protein